MKATAFLPLTLLSLALLAPCSQAKVKTEIVEYKAGDATLQGFLAYDDANTKPRPGILLIHDWMGVGDYAESRAKQLAELGYVAFAADIYGKGVRPADPKEAGRSPQNTRAIARFIASGSRPEWPNLPATNWSRPGRSQSLDTASAAQVRSNCARSGADFERAWCDIFMGG